MYISYGNVRILFTEYVVITKQLHAHLQMTTTSAQADFQSNSQVNPLLRAATP